MVLIAAIGILQIATAQAGLKGLSFFRNPTLDRLFGLMAIVGGFWFFYGTECRNVRSLEGSQQFAYYLAGVFSAFFLTLVVSSLVNFRLRGSVEKENEGLETLKRTSYFRALYIRFRRKINSND